MLRRHRQTLLRTEKQKRMLAVVSHNAKRSLKEITYQRAMLKPQMAFIS